jgi:tetratricopeptide (TPR) repeat protein
MSSAQLLAKLVATTGAISGGAILTLEGKTQTPKAGLEIVPDLVRLVSRTVVLFSSPREEDVEQVQKYLSRLVRRYGTLRQAMEALALGRRRHSSICSEKSAGWLEAMSVTSGAIEPCLRRHASLHHALTDWLDRHHVDAVSKLSAYENWLDSPMPDFDESGTQPTTPRREAGNFGGSGGGKEVRRSLGSPRSHTSKDVELLWLTVLEDKRPTEHPADRVLSEEQMDAIARLSVASDPYERAVAAVAGRDFGKADSFLPHLESRVDAETLAMLRGHRYDLECRWDEALEQYRQANPDSDDAAAQRAIAVSLMRGRKGSRKARFGEAIRTLRSSLRSLPSESIDAARTKAMLAFALVHAPTSSRGDNIRQAIHYYEDALRVIDRELAPQWWAELNHYLGCAIMDCPNTRRAESIPRAIGCFEHSLEVWTRSSSAGHWAAVQYSLGMAWERKPDGVRSENLELALGCYYAALAIRTREVNPIAWARLQNAVGAAWLAFPEGDARQNVERSIAAHTAALEVWARESRRSEWASTQNALATAWTVLPTGSHAERVDNLERAIACFRSTLDIRTKERSPSEWASTQHNLGNALLALGQASESGDVDAHAVRQAIVCFNNALTVRTRQRSAVDWAKTQAALGSALSIIPARDRNALLASASNHLREALGVFIAAGDERNEQHVRKLLKSVRGTLNDGDDVSLVETDEPKPPRIEVNRPRTTDDAAAAEAAGPSTDST